MSDPTITTQEKVTEIEVLIARERQRTGSVNPVLSAIAADLRARLDGAPSVVMLEIDRRIAAVVRSKGALGYDQRRMTFLAQETMARWPAIKQALEKFGAEVGG